MRPGGQFPLIAVLTLGSPVGATPPGMIPVRISIEAPSECGTQDSFYAAIRARTDRVRLADETESGLELLVRLNRRTDEVLGDLRVVDEDGETDTREVRGQTCNEVVEALALTAVLAVDQRAVALQAVAEEAAAEFDELAEPPAPADRAQAPAASAKAPTSKSPPASPLAPPPTRAPPQTTQDSDEMAWALGAKVLAAQVIKPTISLGTSVFLRATWNQEAWSGPSLSLALLHAPSDLLQPPGDVAVRWTAGLLTACPLNGGLAGAVQLRSCLTASGGWLTVSHRTVTHPAIVRRSWWGAGVLAGAGLLVGEKTTLELSAALSVPVVKRSFTTEQPSETVGETPVFSWRCGLGAAQGW